VGEDTDWESVAAGDSHNVAIKTDGSLWAWGDNHHGQTGLGGAVGTEVLTPTRVGTDSTWAMVSAGWAYSAAIKQESSASDSRTLWTWGANATGQLGVGNTVSRDVPTRVGTGSTWESVSAGSSHTLGIRSAINSQIPYYVVYAWGSNAEGQLCNGQKSATPRTVPDSINDTAVNWTNVSAGGAGAFSMARQSNGTLWSWGGNDGGQLGKGSNPLTGETWPYLIVNW
jgi:alpha-tubulin suppressor-like RCC1 family protein